MSDNAKALLTGIVGLIVGASAALIWSAWTLTRGMER